MRVTVNIAAKVLVCSSASRVCALVLSFFQVYTSVWMVKSSLIIAMLISVILASLMTLLYCVSLTVLHQLVVLILEETGLFQVGPEYLPRGFQDSAEPEVLW